MAKDALGHGSNTRGATGAAGMRLKKTYTNGPHTAKVYGNPEYGEHVVKFFQNGQYQPNADYHTDDKQDAHWSAEYQLRRYASQGDASAKAPALANAPQSSATDHLTSHYSSNAGLEAGRTASDYGSRNYSKTAVDKAIASSNRSGRRISGKEAKAIHALLKGRH